jgi:hypothetical protein
MTELHIFKYNSDIVPDFRVFAPNKHGTRFLREVNPIERSRITIGLSIQKFEEDLIYQLFDFIDNPKSTKAIQLKKLQILKKEEFYFVYRNPYDAFVSSIQTGYASSQGHRENADLGANMTNNGHFYTHYYRTLERVLENVENDTISFIELNDLTEFFRIQTLHPVNFSKVKYSFDKYITKDDVEILCKEHHPMLWHRFMVEIEKEKIALNNLIKKFDWKIKINKELFGVENINP